MIVSAKWHTVFKVTVPDLRRPAGKERHSLLACLVKASKAAALAIGLASFTLVGCMPSTNYEDPLSQIGRSTALTSSDQYKTVKLGVIYTENSRNALEVVTTARGRMLVKTTANQTDLDPSFLTKAINDSLRQRFRDVVLLQEFEGRRSAAVDAVVYLDIQVKFCWINGSDTKVAVQGIFVDDHQAPIAQIKESGSGTCGNVDNTNPSPLGFRVAASQAVEQFAQALDGDTELANKLTSSSLTVAQSNSALQQPEQRQAPTEPTPAIASSEAPRQELGKEPTQPMASDRGRRVALVVGNSNYKYVPSLGNPSNDARLMARTLRDLGFSLVGGKAQIDLDKPGFDRAVRSFGDEMRGSTIALFYYAGHGVQVRGTNYLIPVSANPTKESDVDFELVDAQLVLHQMDDGGARLNVLILDACRNNPFGGRGLRSSSGGLAQMQAPKGTLISYSTQPGNVAADGSGRDSPYTEAVVQAIQKPGADILHVFNNVGVIVEQKTDGAQQPWISSSPIEGEFYFAGSSNPP